LNLEARLLLLEESSEQKEKAAAEKKERANTKELEVARVAFEIQVLKRLGYTPDSGKDCTVKQVEAFAAKNIKELKAYVYPDAMGRKTKAQLMEALSRFVRVQQPRGYWLDAHGKPHPEIVVPENIRRSVPATSFAADPRSESAPAPESEPAVAGPGPNVNPGSQVPTVIGQAIQGICPGVLVCAAPAPAQPEAPAEGAPAQVEAVPAPELSAPGVHL